MSQPAPGTDAATLGVLYEYTHGVFRQNTAGIDGPRALAAPAPAGNSMNWIVGHLVAARNGILGLLGREPAFDPARLQRYQRGAAPLTDPKEALDWDELKAAFLASQDPLRAGLAAASTDDLARGLPKDENPFDVASAGQMLHLLNFHETYHVGQLGLLRRIAGLEGAIK